MQQQFPFPSRASPPHRRLSVGPPRLGDLLPTAGWPARREERREREEEEGRGGEENMLTWRLTCGSHVGPTLTQPTRQIKPRPKPPRDLKQTVLLVEGHPVSGFAIGDDFVSR
ncbi:Os09g0524500 [Oryza sativa Japonica Group]|uniref:Os09g0524500 protein n=1 Tax=Oryza sativa subsp. japonica TaxID=39947 RepID=C7J6P1_ORYSJ|nr:Os09g0524500 [Oryza sativa Japonica Group]|eukprot:NP_001175949.1 Os09g0524500 [Oryza sativa Japonica Group]